MRLPTNGTVVLSGHLYIDVPFSQTVADVDYTMQHSTETGLEAEFHAHIRQFSPVVRRIAARYRPAQLWYGELFLCAAESVDVDASGHVTVGVGVELFRMYGLTRECPSPADVSRSETTPEAVGPQPSNGDALLAGDRFLAEAFDLVAREPTDHCRGCRGVDAITTATRTFCETFESASDRDRPRAARWPVVARESGAFAVALAGAFAERSDPDVSRLESAGRSFGAAISRLDSPSAAADAVCAHLADATEELAHVFGSVPPSLRTYANRLEEACTPRLEE